MTTEADVRSILSTTSVPAEVMTELVDGLAGIWVLNEPAELLAADLTHCHPPPGGDEVRMAHRLLEDGTWRLTLVGRDRPGLLAMTAGVLARSGLSVRTAGVTTWPRLSLALQGITVHDPAGRSWSEADWDVLRGQVEAAWKGEEQAGVRWRADGQVKVVSSRVATGENLVTVEAPDRVGLLWAIASWFYGQSINVEAASLSDREGVAVDTFLVAGEAPLDVDRLAAHLVSRPSLHSPWRRLVRLFQR